MKYPIEIIPVCEECKGLEDVTKLCERCGIDYCKHYSSDIDVRYCANCMDDVNLTVSIITKETMRTNPVTKEQTSVKKRIATGYELNGTDWMFQQYHINEMKDDEAKMNKWIEFHHGSYSLLMRLREDKRIERQAKLNQVKINLSPLNGTTTTVHTTRSRTRVDKVVSKPITDPNAIRNAIAAGIQASTGNKPSDAQIDAVMKAMGLGK